MKQSAEMKTEYLIGDVARIVGLSRDTLRFYEKKGIICARKKENGYRYFSEDDIYKLMSIIYHRKMNDSLEDIESFLNGKKPPDTFQKHLKQRMEEEKTEIRRHRQALIRLHLMEQDMKNIEQSLDRFSVKSFPLAYVVGSCPNLSEGLRQWFSLSSAIVGMDMAYFYNILSLKEGTLSMQGTNLLLYKQIADEMRDYIFADSYPLTEEIPCIYTIIKAEQQLPDASIAVRMEKWGRDNGFCPKGIIYSNNMTSFLENEKTIYFMELYMPVIINFES